MDWAYATDLEPPDCDLNPRVIEINGMSFQSRDDCAYAQFYYHIADSIRTCNQKPPEWHIKNPGWNEPNIIRTAALQDLWFLLYFVMKHRLANHPFVVEMCKEIQAETGDSVEMYARDHMKTSVITVGRTVQKVLQNPDRRIGIFSATRPLAVKIQNLIKTVFELPTLQRSFPDILWKDPYKEAPKWTEAPEGGLIVKRAGLYKEATISAWGLIEGMPTGDHYTDMVFDDIVTADHQSPEITEKIKEQFDAALNIGTRDCQITVVGTPYRHDDVLRYIEEKKDPNTDEPIFKVRRKPATENGDYTGRAVFLPERTLTKKRAGNRYIFNCQQLVNPTPQGTGKLNHNFLQIISKRELPKALWRFMLVDPSGDQGRRRDRAADAWAMGVFGVEPSRDARGHSKTILIDGLIKEMDLDEAQKQIVEMYCRNGNIRQLGIEKVGQSTMEIHVANALRARGRFVSLESGNLFILNPAKRSKQFRIESSLSLPLQNSRMFALDTVPEEVVRRIREEMEKFPAWKDDGLDIWAYLFDMIKVYHFGDAPDVAETSGEDRWDRAFRKAREGKNKHTYMTV